MRPVQPCLVEERGYLRGHRGDRRAAAEAERRRLAVAGQVNGNDRAVRRQQVQDRVPGLPPVPEPVQQHQRRPGAVALVGEAHYVIVATGGAGVA
jgi:2-polyprenyl-6-methoxyphenol hydroxylase-like FAD-dependent oxidoreductase